MTTGQNYYLVDRSGLLNRVETASLSKFSADTTSDYAQQIYLNQITELTDAGVDYSRAIAGQAGSVLLLTDATNANKAQDLLFGNGYAEPKLAKGSSVVPFRAPVAANVDHVSNPFMAAAANDEGRGRAPKLGGEFTMVAGRTPSLGLRTIGLENNGIAA